MEESPRTAKQEALRGRSPLRSLSYRLKIAIKRWRRRSKAKVIHSRTRCRLSIVNLRLHPSSIEWLLLSLTIDRPQGLQARCLDVMVEEYKLVLTKTLWWLQAFRNWVRPQALEEEWKLWITTMRRNSLGFTWSLLSSLRPLRSSNKAFPEHSNRTPPTKMVSTALPYGTQGTKPLGLCTAKNE